MERASPDLHPLEPAALKNGGSTVAQNVRGTTQRSRIMRRSGGSGSRRSRRRRSRGRRRRRRRSCRSRSRGGGGGRSGRSKEQEEQDIVLYKPRLDDIHDTGLITKEEKAQCQRTNRSLSEPIKEPLSY